MKKTRKIISTLILTLWISLSFAQGPPDGDGGGSTGGGTVGGSAPIGSGVYIMIASGLAYGFAKIKFLNKSDLNKIG